MEIHGFDFDDHAARAAFLALPERLHAADANWLPPAAAEQERLLSRDNRFFDHGEMTCFLAKHEGRIVGRCAAIHDRGQKHADEPVGQVGFFDCEDDVEVAKALVGAACDWLRGRGLPRALGPINFSIWHAYRLMTRGFASKAFHGEPYNPPYYPRLFEASGFAPFARWYAWDLTEQHMRAMREMAFAQAKAIDYFPEHRPIDMARFDDELAVLHGLLMEGFKENVGAAPIGLDEFRAIYARLREVVIPELARTAYTAEGDLIGFGLLYPDVSDYVRAARGLGAPPERPDCLMFNTVVVRQVYRKRGPLYGPLASMIEHALTIGFRRGIGGPAPEGPTVYAKTGPASREYTLYARDL
jgi:hypothetical protein